jgi:hemolysin activation/secretion protein
MFGPMLRTGLVNTVRIRQTGWSLEVRPSLGITNAPDFPTTFGRFFSEWLYFKMLGNRWNIAWRAQAGAMTRAQSQQHFFLGGFDLIRGFKDNYIETDLFALTNVEVRFTALDFMFLALQPTVFVDAAIARNTATGAAQGVVSAGGGVRILVPRFVRSGFRVDVAVPLVPGQKPGLSAGVYQFF